MSNQVERHWPLLAIGNYSKCIENIIVNHSECQMTSHEPFRLFVIKKVFLTVCPSLLICTQETVGRYFPIPCCCFRSWRCSVDSFHLSCFCTCHSDLLIVPKTLVDQAVPKPMVELAKVQSFSSLPWCFLVPSSTGSTVLFLLYLTCLKRSIGSYLYPFLP